MTTNTSADIGSTSITTLGVITTGTWNASVITGTYGGTGVNNGASTFTYGGNTVFSGAFTFTGTITGNTSVTFPTSGTLATTAQLPTLGAGVATWLATPTSANLRTAVATTSTGTGSLVFNTSPTFVTPTLGAAIATTLQIGNQGILDANANNMLAFSPAASPVNYIVFGNSATGNPVTITGGGSDTNVGFNLATKGNSGVGIQGTSAGGNASAGYVGELITSAAGPVAITMSATAQDLTSITLTPGDWDVYGNIAFSPSVAFSQVFAWTSITSASLVLTSGGTFANSYLALNTQYLRVNVTVNTVIYLSGYAAFASGTATFNGGIYARRVR